MHLEITDTRTLSDETPKRRKLEFHNTPISIGSASANTIQLPDTNIPQYHAMVLPQGDEGDAWLLQPTALDVEILINDAPVAAPIQLEDGDVITITYFQILFSLDLPTELALPEPGDLDELAKIKQYPLPPRADVRKGDDDVVLSQAKQRALADFGLKLRACVDTPELMDVTLEALLPELGARTAWIGVRRSNSGPLEQVVGRSAKGKYTGEPWMLEGLCYRCMTRHQYIRIPKTTDPETQSLIAVPIVGDRGAIGLIVSDTRRRTRVFDESDLDFVTIVSRLVNSQLEAIIDQVANQREQNAAGELSLLRQVQSRIDPHNAPQWSGVQIAAFAKPGLETAGDIYDIVRPPNGLVTTFVGNVSSAGTLRTAQAMTEARAAFRTGSLHADPPHVQLRVLNWLLYDEKEPCSLSAAVIVMNPKTGLAEYCIAGDIGALIVDARGNMRSLAGSNNPAVGSAKVLEYAVKKEHLRNGETLAFFTWGCAAARNENGEPLGKTRFVDALCDGFGQSASATLDDLLVDLGSYLKDGSPPDDITILLLHKGPAQT